MHPTDIKNFAAAKVAIFYCIFETEMNVYQCGQEIKRLSNKNGKKMNNISFYSYNDKGFFKKE